MTRQVVRATARQVAKVVHRSTKRLVDAAALRAAEADIIAEYQALATRGRVIWSPLSQKQD